MQQEREWIIDANGDGYPDDVTARLQLNPVGGVADRTFWAALLDVAARIGLEVHALPLPLVLVGMSDRLPAGIRPIVVRGVADLHSLVPDPPANALESTSASTPLTPCLTRLFTIDGALEDRDGDLLPDASRIAFDLPETLPVTLGAALANFAARVGLESGGVTFPLVRDSGARFVVRPGDGPASLRVTDSGWLAEGDADQLARLIERVATTWPHITSPETGGVGTALAELRRWLSGDGQETSESSDAVIAEVWRDFGKAAVDDDWFTYGRVAFAHEWSATWEVDAVLDEIETETLEWLLTLPPGQTPDITVFVSEPPEERARLADAIRTELEDEDFLDSSVTVLSAFKAGLSWLREVVTPALAGTPVARVRVSYRRYDAPEGALDMPIRWLQELFPGPEIMARELGIPLDVIELVEAQPEQTTTYVAEAFGADGALLGIWTCSPPYVVQPFVDVIEGSGTVVAPSGGIVIHGGVADRTIEIATDLQSFWGYWQEIVLPRVFELVDEHGARAAAQPFFGELLAEVWVSEPNERLGVREENDSAAEALAEDIYFSTLDAIELYARAKTGERCNAPGAIIPIVHVTPGAPPRARVTILRAAPTQIVEPRPELRVSGLRLEGDALALDIDIAVTGSLDAMLSALKSRSANLPIIEPSIRTTVHLGDEAMDLRLHLPSLLEPLPAVEPPTDRNIHGDEVTELARRMAAFPEVTTWVEEHSYQGREIVTLTLRTPTPGRLHSPMKEAIFKPTHLIIARHHANEISSTNAAFQLAWLCGVDPEWRQLLERVNIVLLPYENPDGAALHVRLASEPEAARWKHHPARYNALGYEFGEAHFDPDTRFGEARARTQLWHRQPADVVVDNHGVPSHEWVQPFAGFGSPRFVMSYWIVQALLYGIARYVDHPDFPEHRAAVEALRSAVSANVAGTDIEEWNRVYWESYRSWGQDRLPEHFPGDFSSGMLWHIDAAPPDPAGRGFTTRYPKTTVLSWVTEVNDETAEGEHLERVARAHLLANQATLRLMAAAADPPRWWRTDDADGIWTLRVGRQRPLALGNRE